MRNIKNKIAISNKHYSVTDRGLVEYCNVSFTNIQAWNNLMMSLSLEREIETNLLTKTRFKR